MTYKQAKHDEKRNIILTQRRFRKFIDRKNTVEEPAVKIDCKDEIDTAEKFFPDFLNKKVFTSNY